MKRFKRLGALLLAMVMVLSMSVTALAAGDLGTDGKVGSSESPAGSTVTIKKAITVTNHDGYTYEPTITYTYTLQDGTAAGTVSDGAVTVNYKAGLVSYLATGSTAAQTAVFSSETEVTATGNANASHDLSWTFNPEAFPSAGVYRYVLTETNTSVAPASIGIVRPTAYDTTKYLDVYVQNGTSGNEIYGYVLVDDEASTVTSSSAKSQGWNSGDDLETYDTYNVTIIKHITGAGADKTQKFPFKVVLTGEMTNANIAVAGGTGESISSFSLTEGSGDTKDTATVTGNLGDGKSIIIKGLPKTVTYTVAESNPTPDTYEIKTVTVTGETATGTTGNLSGNATDTSVLSGGNIANATGAITIEVTNNLDTISPTGVVLRFAPYMLILAAGIVLLALTRRRKTVED